MHRGLGSKQRSLRTGREGSAYHTVVEQASVTSAEDVMDHDPHGHTSPH